MSGMDAGVFRGAREIVPLNPALADRTAALEAALGGPYSAVPDLKRPGFYEVIASGEWFYVHVYRSKIFLVGYGVLKGSKCRAAPGRQTAARAVGRADRGMGRLAWRSRYAGWPPSWPGRAW